MQSRAERTRQALVEATAELIADGRPADAGLVNICHRAGVSRGALYHHFPSIGALTDAVREEARARLLALLAEAFAVADGNGLERFLVLFGRALREEKIVRAGMRLAADGPAGPPRLRDELLALVRERVAGPPGSGPRGRDLADLALVLTVGVEALGHADPRWWEAGTVRRLWQLLRPVFPPPSVQAPEPVQAPAPVQAPVPGCREKECVPASGSGLPPAPGAGGGTR
ncbi:TetR/AcrR family transcriptional regulator [Streptomyces sp. NPDC038707]|uniref:TetR/AcrR family transcriptional regulator n=1 Tax=unclassified Streptomyces TaxID=2593676 RepID=UPI0033E4F5EF